MKGRTVCRGATYGIAVAAMRQSTLERMVFPFRRQRV